MPEVSIIVPVYKVEPYLEKCVASILRQSIHDIEVILVDDGSPDKCPEICDRFAAADRRVQVIHQQNKGLGGARNTGIAAASAPFLLFVDSDDTIHERTAELTLTAAKMQDADMVVFDCVRVSEDGGVLYSIPSPMPKNHPVSLCDFPGLLAIHHFACNKLLRRSLFTENGIKFPDHMWYEDLATIPKLYPHIRRAVYADAPPLYNYLMRGDSIMSGGNPDRMMSDRLTAVRMVLDDYIAAGLAEQYRNELEWLAVYHGFFLTAKEISMFTPDVSAFVLRIRAELGDLIARNPRVNPYYVLLNRKERLLFRLFLKNCFGLIRLAVKLYSLRAR